jgi:hypothetical protein
MTTRSRSRPTGLPSPISLQIAAPRDVDVPVEALQQGDAVLSSKRAAFRVVVTPRSVGDRLLTFVLSFSVCDSRACHAVEERATFKLRVR